MPETKDLPYTLVDPEPDHEGVDHCDDLLDEEGDPESTSRSSQQRSESRVIRVVHQPWIADEKFIMWGDEQLFDGIGAVRLIKFFVLTAVVICLTHEFVRLFDIEHDSQYSYSEMILYDGPGIVSDTVVFFFVGRLHGKLMSVDHLAWVLVVLAGSVFMSLETTVSWLRHSFTLREIHCSWPWQLFVFVLIVVPLSCALIIKHVQYAVQHHQFGMKLLEISICLVLFLAPQVSPYFHLHHWYVGWLIGMHCNYDTWWSRAIQAWFWGIYANGIAVYGRDPLQTCGYAFYISEDTRCSFLKCFMHNATGPDNSTHPEYNHPDVPDWRNCSSR
jgi:hypothetical protein